nr:ATP-binding protein [Streptomyces spiramenti]
MTSCTGSVGTARSWVRDLLRSGWLGEQLDDVVLITSELVSNAVQHGSTGSAGETVTVTVEVQRGGLAPDSVTVSVHDRVDAAPEQRAAGLDDECGRGLALVEELAHDVGVSRHPGVPGKDVWARVLAT